MLDLEYMDWKMLVPAGVFFVCLAIATAMETAKTEDGRPILPAIFTFQALFLLWAAIIAYRYDGKIAWPSLDKGGWLIFLGFSIIYVTLAIRLLLYSHFGGSIGLFSFGNKCDDDGCELNIAFGPSLNTLGHTIQGCLSVFLFSDMFLARIAQRRGDLFQRRQTILQYIRESLALCVCTYPVYNVVKRAIFSADTFATSSFSNNASEWACGFAMGTCAVFSFYALMYSSSGEARFKELKEAQQMPRPLAKARIVAGIALILASVTSVILYAVSWNNVEDAPEESDDWFLVILQMVVPLAILGVLVIFLKGRYDGSTHNPEIKIEIRQFKGDKNKAHHIELQNLQFDINPL